ncbi:MAG: hypothetical protein HRT47_10915 [Candidatus Caenarcaniphilales bacterium]|nr:hypothetical protein [Candidatus Caenarcaniphilales bacterium]
MLNSRFEALKTELDKLAGEPEKIGTRILDYVGQPFRLLRPDSTPYFAVLEFDDEAKAKSAQKQMKDKGIFASTVGNLYRTTPAVTPESEMRQVAKELAALSV